MKLRFYIGILFLALQFSAIIYARFIPERFFCWAPYDNHTRFEVFVTIDEKTLTFDEAQKRYKYITNGWEQRSIYNVFSLITQYEMTYGKHDNAKVKVTYSTNGHETKQWNLQR